MHSESQGKVPFSQSEFIDLPDGKCVSKNLRQNALKARVINVIEKL